MSRSYVDSSWIVAIALSEAGAAPRRKALRSFETVFSSDLLEAEVRSVLARENTSLDRVEHFLQKIDRVRPARRLSAELDHVLRAGYLRGGDLWHVACALYLSPDPSEITFLTLDREQKRVARRLGFRMK